MEKNVRSEGKSRTSLRCQQICNRHAEYSARNLEKMSNLPRYKSLKIRPEEKGLQFLTTRRQWRNGRDWGRQAITRSVLIQPLGVHGRRVLNGSSVPRPTCPRRKSVDGDDRQRRRFDGGCRQDVGAVLWRQRSTKTHSRNQIRPRIHSQWSSSSNGDTWSDFLVEKTAWAVHSGLIEKAYPSCSAMPAIVAVNLTDHEGTDQCQ